MPEAAVMAARSLRLSLRSTDALVTALALPVMVMLMFVYLFGGAIRTGGHYVDYVVPGVIVLCAAFGGATTAVSVAADMAGGTVDRLRALDVRPATMLAGHVAASVARNALSTLLVIAVAVLVGFRPSASVLDWAAAAGVLAGFLVAVSWLSAAIGLLASSPEGANGLAFGIGFVPYASSAFVPVATMPDVVRAFAAHQPVTPVVETLRALLTGAGTSDPWTALAWCAAISAAALVASGALFRRRVYT